MGSPDSNLSPYQFEIKARPSRRWYQRWWGRVVAVLLVGFLSLAVAYGFYVASLVREIKAGTTDGGNTNLPGKRADLSAVVTDADPSTGPREAAVVVVEFSDFECPFCAQMAPVVAQLIQDYGDRVRFIYKDFPIEELHPRAVPAALAAQCAHEQGKFWAMHDAIFTHQDSLSDIDLKRYAVQIGLDSIQFGQCYQSGKYLAAVNEDFQQGLTLGVNSTPTFFVNGIGIRGAVPLATLQQLILAELNRSTP